MENITISRTFHNGKAVIALHFPYNKTFLTEFRKQFPQALYSQTMRCWYVSDTPEQIDLLEKNGLCLPKHQFTNNDIGITKQDKSSDILVRFANYMRERRYSPRTVDAYTECLQIFFRYHSQKDILGINNADVSDFNQHYILERRLSATYQT